MNNLCAESLENPKNKELLVRAIKSVIASKQFGQEDFLSDLIADAAIHTTPTNAQKFNVDNVRI